MTEPELFFIDVPDGESVPSVEPGEVLTLFRAIDGAPIPVLVKCIEGRRIWFTNITVQ